LSDPLLGEASSEKGSPRQVRTAAPLPLLEFALERLWLQAVDRGSQEFSHDDYDRMGGLGGAIAQHADDVYKALPLKLSCRFSQLGIPRIGPVGSAGGYTACGTRGSRRTDTRELVGEAGDGVQNRSAANVREVSGTHVPESALYQLALSLFGHQGQALELIAAATRPSGPGVVEIEAADDFVLSTQSSINSASFVGLTVPNPTGGSFSVSNVTVEIYRMPGGRLNSPSSLMSSCGRLT
jgi:hypothetical protein